MFRYDSLFLILPKVDTDIKDSDWIIATSFTDYAIQFWHHLVQGTPQKHILLFFLTLKVN